MAQRQSPQASAWQPTEGPTPGDREIDVAAAAVRAAAGVTRAVQQSLVTAQTLEKRDKSPVTVADFASQAVVCAALARQFPEDAVVGEEDAAALREPSHDALRRSVLEQVRTRHQSAGETQVLEWIDRGGFDPKQDPSRQRYWTLDPIDGTKGFLRGEQYAIALALIEEGRVVLGVLGCPNLPRPGHTGDKGNGGGEANRGVLMIAARVQGARARPLWAEPGEAGEVAREDEAAPPVHVSEVSEAAAARFCESVESGHSDQSQSARIARRLSITSEPVRMDSQAKYAAVARGDASIYLRLPTRPGYQEKIWDHAAGAIVVEEAGGRVTDMAGHPLDFSRGRTLASNQGIIATNGRVHDAVLAAVAEVKSE